MSNQAPQLTTTKFTLTAINQGTTDPTGNNLGTIIGDSIIVDKSPFSLPSNLDRPGSGVLGGVALGSVATADFNGNGHIDILLTGNENSNSISQVYLNDGSGGFTPVTNIDLPGVFNSSVATADFNGNGHIDILLTGLHSFDFSPEQRNISQVYLNDGSGGFTPATNIDLPGVSSSSVATADFNGNGHIDILLTGRHTFRKNLDNGGTSVETEYISRVYLNDGSGGFTRASTLDGVTRGSVATADFNGNGHIDILLTGFDNGFNPISQVYFNNGSGGFTRATNIALPGVYMSSVATADFNGDGHIDILLTGNDNSNSISRVYLNDGSGGFTQATNIDLTGVVNSSVATADFNGDGHIDILLTGTDRNPISQVYLNDGSGGFTQATNIDLTHVDYSSVATADFNGDGQIDILLTGSSRSTPGLNSQVYINNYSVSVVVEPAKAIYEADISNGAWQYSTDGGTTWVDFPAVSETNALLLDGSSQVRFIPNADYAGEAAYSFRAWDKSDGLAVGSTTDVSDNGGTTAYSATTGTATVTVTVEGQPRIEGVTLPEKNNYGIGQEMVFTVTFSQEVTISGNVFLPITLNTEGVVNATLVGTGESATTHSFRYIIAEGDENLDGIELGSELILAGGATIVNSNGMSSLLTLNAIGDTTAILIDGIVPVAPTITSTGATNDTTPEITGTAEVGSTVAILNNGEQIGEVQADADGNWSFTPTTPLPEGEISLTATVTDAAGNVSMASTPVTITIDTSSEDDSVTDDPVTDDPVTDDPVTDDPVTDDPVTGGESNPLPFQIFGPTGPAAFNQFPGNNPDSALSNPVSTPLVDVASILADVPGLSNFSITLPTLPTLEITLNNTPGNPVLIGTPEPDALMGTNEAEFIQGLGGNDQIFGLEGNDIIHGNQGDDFIDAGPGDDLVHGGQGNDFILAHSGNNEIYGDLGNDTLVGGPGNEFMNGNQGNDVLFAVAGNNILHGGQGEDTLVGGTGSDELFGDLGNDLIYAVAGNNFLYGNQGNDTLVGGDDDDVLYGGKGDDLLIGGAGNDWLFGDLGNDTLIGGAGFDRFVIRPGAGVDLIVDFTDGEDLIGLAEGLTYDDITLTQGSNGAVISVGNEVLAILNGVDVAVLDVQDFFEAF